MLQRETLSITIKALSPVTIRSGLKGNPTVFAQDFLKSTDTSTKTVPQITFRLSPQGHPSSTELSLLVNNGEKHFDTSKTSALETLARRPCSFYHPSSPSLKVLSELYGYGSTMHYFISKI